MKLSDDIQAKIVAYLTNELSVEEHKEFEHLLAHDDELRAEVEEQAMIDSLFFEDADWVQTEYSDNHTRAKEYFAFYQNENNKQFLRGLKQIDSSAQNQALSFWKKSYVRVAIIAATILILALLIPKLFTPSGDQLYSRYASYNSLPGLTNKADEQVLAQAENAFNQGDYKQAASMFKEISDSENTSDLIGIYYALSLAEINAIDDALNEIQPLTQNNQSTYQNEATWYAAMIAIKGNNRPLAKEYLNAYLSLPSPLLHQAEAKRLLKKLR